MFDKENLYKYLPTFNDTAFMSKIYMPDLNLSPGQMLNMHCEHYMPCI